MKTPVPESLFQESCGPEGFIKEETLAQLFSCEFCKIFRNIFFYRTTPVVASVYLQNTVGQRWRKMINASLQFTGCFNSVAYLELCKISKMERFAKIVNGF